MLGEESGAPIILLHAFPLNQTMWDDQVKALRVERRVITFDWRGFGESATGAEGAAISRFADDLAGLLDQLGIDRTIICGLSMGGYAAFAFYRKYAKLVSALILADTRAQADTEEGRQARYDVADLVRKSGPSALVETMIPRLLGETTLRNNPQVVDRVRRMIESNTAEGIAQASLAMAARGDSTDLLEQIDCPALVVVGAEDKLTPPSEAEKMSSAIRNAKFEIISGAGHLPNIEQPNDFNLVITKVIEKL
ncbi:MAG: alpha/beta fold hydrolase [Blastocatellales bacterium]